MIEKQILYKKVIILILFLLNLLGCNSSELVGGVKTSKEIIKDGDKVEIIMSIISNNDDEILIHEKLKDQFMLSSPYNKCKGEDYVLTKRLSHKKTLTFLKNKEVKFITYANLIKSTELNLWVLNIENMGEICVPLDFKIIEFGVTFFEALNEDQFFERENEVYLGHVTLKITL